MLSEQDLPSGDRPIVVPFLKWAGGKRWLTNQFPEIFPQNFSRYVEPFLGGGAVYFHLQPETAVLADANTQLINTYQQRQENWQAVWKALKRHQRKHTSEYYYIERNRQHRAPHEAAAQFLYLNRTCWNGLYRVNLDGKFNVPIGTKDSVLMPTDNWRSVSNLLSRAMLTNSDFSSTIEGSCSGDFVFIDPPYVTRHNLNGFLKYNHKIFNWDDQIRLRDAVMAAARRGAKILVTNADHESIRDLYANVGRHLSLSRQSVLAADSRNRGVTTELAIAVNYDPGIER